jgi:hypothetical protein
MITDLMDVVNAARTWQGTGKSKVRTYAEAGNYIANNEKTVLRSVLKELYDSYLSY